jgi:ADP-ribosylglycohydrolase
VIREDYILKTYAGWLGKIIGIRLGSPIEGWNYEQIQRVYGEITDYLVDYKDYAADDDSNGPLFFVRALIDYMYQIEKITEKEMGYTLLNYAPENHGFFWWGGYGISTEHTAYYNLKNGMNAPDSGSIKHNGLACAEQIGGQIFSDCWGFVVPGNPELAAEYAKKMASVTHDGEGILGAMFVAGCISAAYEETDINKVIEIGLQLLPAQSEYAGVARKVIEFYSKDEEKNWRNGFKFVYDNFGYDKYPGNCHIIPNAAVMILSMLYGQGDYSKTQTICNMCGWDTDCNAGNVGAILGVLVGIDQIEDKWIKPINDLLISSSLIGNLNILTVAKSTEIFCDLGYKIAGMEPPKEWKEYFRNENYVLHFNLPKSTQAMRVRTSDIQTEASLSNVPSDALENKRYLKVVANRLKSDTELKIYHKTYYQPKDLHDSRYDPSFTPILYTGQTIKAVLKNASGFEIFGKLYVKDINNQEIYYSDPYKLTEEWTELEYRIPVIENCLIKEAGIVLYKSADTNVNDKVVEVYIDTFGFYGMPQYNIDFSKERIENYGFGHSTLHKEISQFTYKNGMWELDGEYLSGSCCDEGEAYTGYYYQKDYEYQCTVNPQCGEIHLIQFRVQGGIRSYAFGFYGENQIALLKKHRNYSILAKKEYPLKYDEDYELKVQVKGQTITAFVNCEKVFECRDDEFAYGQIGLSVRNGSHCHYKNIKVNRL